MKVYILTYETVVAYSDGTKYTGVQGVFLSHKRAEQEKRTLEIGKSFLGFSDTYFEIEEFEVDA